MAIDLPKAIKNFAMSISVASALSYTIWIEWKQPRSTEVEQARTQKSKATEKHQLILHCCKITGGNGCSHDH